jgi:hypothetical protein
MWSTREWCLQPVLGGQGETQDTPGVAWGPLFGKKVVIKKLCQCKWTRSREVMSYVQIVQIFLHAMLINAIHVMVQHARKMGTVFNGCFQLSTHFPNTVLVMGRYGTHVMG